MVCIQENGRYNNNTFRLSYFALPLKANSEPIHVYDSEEVWTYEYMVRKANNVSTICWFKGRHDDGFEMRSYEFVDGVGKYKVFNHANEIAKGEGLNKCEVAITTAWEMRPNEYLLVCISNRTKPTESTQEAVNNNYVWNVQENSMREAKFNFGPYQDLHLDQHNFGNTCMFRTFDFENGAALSTPVYYIDNASETIIAQEEWKCSYRYKYDFPGTDGNMIVENQYENGNVEEIIVSGKKIMDPREISLHFMCEIIDNPDDDLMYEVLHTIDYGKSFNAK